MKTGVAHILYSDRTMRLSYKPDRQSEPLLHAQAADSMAEAVAAARAFADQNNFSLDRTILGIDGRTCFLRHYDLPGRGRAELARIVAFQMADDLPVDSSDVVMDSFSSTARDGVAQVSAAAIGREQLGILLADFAEAGIDVLSVDLDVAALGRACLPLLQSEESAIGLDIGEERILFTHLHGSSVERLAVIPWGTADMVQACAQEQNITTEEMERQLLAPETGHTLTDQHLKQFANRILLEVRRLLGGEAYPPRFIISGDIVRATAFRPALETGCNGTVDVWEEKMLPPGSEVDQGLRGSGLATLFGLAERSAQGFDFRREEFRRSGSAASWGREAIWGLGLALLLALALTIYAMGHKLSAEQEITDLQHAATTIYRNTLPDVNPNFSAVQYQSILDSRLAALGSTAPGQDKGGPAPVIEILLTASTALDQSLDVEFVNLSVDPERMMIQGTAASMNEVDEVRAALDASGAFSGVEVKNATADKRAGNIRFEIEVLR